MGAGDVAGSGARLRAVSSRRGRSRRKDRLAALKRSLTAVAIIAAAFSSAAAEPQARSADGRWILRADNDARVLLVVEAASGTVARRIAVADRRGATSRVTRIVEAPSRRSLVALLADLPEAWELLYDPDAAPVFDGLVHDYRMGEGLATAGPLPVRRIVLDSPLADGLFSPDHRYFVARAGDGRVHIVSLDVRRVIERLRIDGDPAPERGLSWNAGGALRFAFPDRRAARVHLLAADGWRWDESLEMSAPAGRLLWLADDRPAAELATGETVPLR
jgi:hypothetical protein